MDITIRIETDEDELVSRHLLDIKNKIKKYLKENPDKNDGIHTIEHNNCDGYWICTLDFN